MKSTMYRELRNLSDVCKRYDHIYIYGAGRNAGLLFFALQAYQISVKGFVVSEMKGNPETLFDLPVVPVEGFHTPERSLILVSMIREGKICKEVFDYLVRNKIHNTFFISRDLIWEINDTQKRFLVPKKLTGLKELREERLLFQLRAIFQDSFYSLGTEVPVEKEHSIFTMTDEKGDVFHWRFRDTMIFEQNIRNISALFLNKTPLAEYEELFGKYIPLQSIKSVAEKIKKTCIVYMAKSHFDVGKPSKELLPPWIMPLQVGAALTNQQICGLMDNMGGNISEKNGIYSEGTGLYWMWKNAPRTDYIGLCHYRRHFLMSEQELLNLMNADVDVLVTTPTFVNETVEEFLSTIIPRTDFMVMLEVISRVCPEYLPTAHKFLQARFYPPCNLSIMKWELFQKYAEYMFSVTFEIERFYNELCFIRQDRYMGYIVECLLGIFLMHHKENLRIAYTDMEFYDKL